MKNADYKALCRRIHSRYGKPLNLLYVDACELADTVLWGQMSEDALFFNLQAQASSEMGRGNQPC